MSSIIVNPYSFGATLPLWDISSPSLQATKLLTEAGNAFLTTNSIFFKPDGTEFFTIDLSQDDIMKWDCPTPWDISSSSGTPIQQFDMTSEDTSPVGLFIKPDGTTAFVTGDNNNIIIEYDMSTPWDLTTMSLTTTIPANKVSPQGIFFKPDGTEFFIINLVSGSSTIDRYTCVTPWSLVGATYDSDKDLAFPTFARDLYIRADGAQLFVTGSDFGLPVADREFLRSYQFLIPWDISTIITHQEFRSSISDDPMLGIFFNPDGTRFFSSHNSDQVEAYNI